MIEKVGSILTKIFDHLKMLGVYFFSITALGSAIWGMVAISAEEIDAKVTAVSTGSAIVVELIAYKVPEISATVYYRLDGTEVLHHHYLSLPDGKKVQVLPLPLETHSEVRVDVEIILEGLRTLFTDNTVKYTQYVVVQ